MNDPSVIWKRIRTDRQMDKLVKLNNHPYYVINIVVNVMLKNSSYEEFDELYAKCRYLKNIRDVLILRYHGMPPYIGEKSDILTIRKCSGEDVSFPELLRLMDIYALPDFWIQEVPNWTFDVDAVVARYAYKIFKLYNYTEEIAHKFLDAGIRIVVDSVSAVSVTQYLRSLGDRVHPNMIPFPDETNETYSEIYTRYWCDLTYIPDEVKMANIQLILGRRSYSPIRIQYNKLFGYEYYSNNMGLLGSPRNIPLDVLSSVVPWQDVAVDPKILRYWAHLGALTTDQIIYTTPDVRSLVYEKGISWDLTSNQLIQLLQIGYEVYILGEIPSEMMRIFREYCHLRNVKSARNI